MVLMDPDIDLIYYLKKKTNKLNSTFAKKEKISWTRKYTKTSMYLQPFLFLLIKKCLKISI